MRGSYRRGKDNELDWIPEPIKKCPKCGSEMERRAAVYTLSVPERWVCHCGYEKKLTEKEACGYETCNCVGCM